WSAHRSSRSNPRANRSGSWTTDASSLVLVRCFAILRLHHHRLQYTDRNQRLAILPGVFHGLYRLPEAAIGEPCPGIDAIPELGVREFAAKQPQHEGDQLLTVARLLPDSADQALRSAARVPGLALLERPARPSPPRCWYIVLSHPHHLHLRPCRCARGA